MLCCIPLTPALCWFLDKLIAKKSGDMGGIREPGVHSSGSARLPQPRCCPSLVWCGPLLHHYLTFFILVCWFTVTFPVCHPFFAGFNLAVSTEGFAAVVKQLKQSDPAVPC